MFQIIAGIVEGFFAGMFFNWVVFDILLDYGKNKPEWLLTAEVIMVIVFICAGFLLTICLPTGNKEQENGR